uniref:Ig-like domain-containing protein n=1 Tax=Periophthalmus magnuspinnatus TaxID=409849 RepID=A0A3B3ZB22_9GOBI
SLVLVLTWLRPVLVLFPSWFKRHALTYIYTALSRKVPNPGIHEFTAMGLLDTKMIDYFDSEQQQKVPKQEWMRERLGQDYWEKGTQSRKSKQQWFKVNLDILKERMNQTDNDVHVLQWMHGCEADLLSNGKLQFQRGIDQYSYNGDNFLYFDDAHSVWVAAATAAEPTKRKWDEVHVLKEYTKGYLEKECLDWLGKFMDYGKQQLKHTTLRLNCMATGFYPPDIILRLLRDGMILGEDDGIMTTGIRPNEDDTYQLRDSIEILSTDQGQYTCHVIHLYGPLFHLRLCLTCLCSADGKVNNEGGFPVGGVVGGVIGLLVVVALCITVILVKRRQSSESNPYLILIYFTVFH